MGKYTKCPGCGNEKRGEPVAQCKNCNHTFCKTCGNGWINIDCPNCGSGKKKVLGRILV